MATLGRAFEFDQAKLNAFMERVVADMGAAIHATLVVVGDKLGLYRAMAGAEPPESSGSTSVVSACSAGARPTSMPAAMPIAAVRSRARASIGTLGGSEKGPETHMLSRDGT